MKIPASTQNKVEAVKGQLYDHHTALDILLTAARSKEVSANVSSGTVDTITSTRAALELTMAAENAAEMVETGVQEAQEAVVEIVKEVKPRAIDWRTVVRVYTAQKKSQGKGKG